MFALVLLVTSVSFPAHATKESDFQDRIDYWEDYISKNEAGEETDEIVFDLETPKAAEYAPVMSLTLNGAAVGSDLDGQFSFHLKDDEGMVIETVSNQDGKAEFSALKDLDDIGSYYYTIVPADYDEETYAPEHDVIHVAVNIHKISDGAFVPEVRYDLGSYDAPLEDLTFNWFSRSYMVVSDEIEIGLTENGKDPAGVYYFERINDTTHETELIANTGSITTLNGITFGAPGEYAYTIRIRNDNPAMIENTKVYHLTYTVEEADGKLVIASESCTDESGKAVDSISFSIESKTAASYTPTASVTLDGQEPADGTLEAVLKDDEGKIINLAEPVVNWAVFYKVYDRDERKMSLGIKQLKNDPWENIEGKYPVGSQHTAKVRNFTNFGVFVEIEEGVDGLIHISDLSWTKKIKHPSEFTQNGADIQVQVLEIDKENRRLSLGHKQLEENPWDVFETVFTLGSIHEGTIVELVEKGAVIALPYGVEGFATPKHLVKEDGSNAVVDEKLNFKVIEFNKDSKRIILSHSRIFEDEAKAEKAEAKKATKRASKKVAEETAAVPAVEKTTLGDIEELAALKEKLAGK